MSLRGDSAGLCSDRRNGDTAMERGSAHPGRLHSRDASGSRTGLPHCCVHIPRVRLRLDCFEMQLVLFTLYLSRRTVHCEIRGGVFRLAVHPLLVRWLRMSRVEVRDVISRV